MSVPTIAGGVAAVQPALDAPPKVVSVTPSVLTITEEDVGATFNLKVAFNDTMDQTVFPTISFPTVGGDPTVNTLVDPTGAWLDAQTFQETYDVADSQEVLPNISVEVSGGQNTSGFVQTKALLPNVFTVDTRDAQPTTPPVVRSVTPSVTTITDADVGNGKFTLRVIFNHTMDQTVLPTVSFPTAGEDPTENTLIDSTGAWTNNRTFVATFDVADAEEVLPTIDVRVEGGRNTSGILQTPILVPDVFTVDTVEPKVQIKTPNGARRFPLGQPVNFTFTATHASPLVQNGTFTFHVTWGDGTQQNLKGTSPLTKSHVFTTPGTAVLTVNVTDQFGSKNITPTTLPITLLRAMRQGPNLLLAGTGGNDRFTLTRGASPSQFFVSLNNESLGKFTVGAGGRVQINGLKGNDTVAVQGTSGSNTFTVTNTGIVLDGTPIDGPNLTTFVLNGGGGSDTLVGCDVPNTFNLTGRRSGNLNNGKFRFFGVRNLTGGSDANTFVVANGATGFGTIKGNGNGTLNFAALTQPFSVNLQDSSAFGITRFVNMTNLVGSNRTTATLIGPNTATTFVIDGRNRGTVAGLTFSRFANLTGGKGHDRFEIVGTAGSPGAISGRIDGGGGLNVLDYSDFPVSGSAGVRVDLGKGTATAVGGAARIRVVVGSSGNDTLIGGNQGDVLLGGPGNDRLQEGSGRDLLIGGSGTGDTLRAGGDGNILVGGTTTYYNESTGALDINALGAILSAWGKPGAGYAARIAALTTGSSPLISSTTMLQEAAAANHLFGGQGRDFFIVSPGDQLHDRQTDETVLNV